MRALPTSGLPLGNGDPPRLERLALGIPDGQNPLGQGRVHPVRVDVLRPGDRVVEPPDAAGAVAEPAHALPLLAFYRDHQFRPRPDGADILAGDTRAFPLAQ